jgi:hypothetical protein
MYRAEKTPKPFHFSARRQPSRLARLLAWDERPDNTRPRPPVTLAPFPWARKPLLDISEVR